MNSTSIQQESTVQSTSEDQMWIDVEDVLNTTAACIFCTRKVRRRNGVNQRLTKASDTRKKRILEILLYLNQQNKVDDFQNSNSIEYHLCCLAEHEHKISIANKIVKEASNLQKLHMVALTKVEENVQATVINNREIRLFSDVYQYYVAFFDEQETQSEVNSCDPIYNSNQLLKKLLKMWPILTKTVYKNRTYLHLQELPVEEIYVKSFQHSEDMMARIKKVAFEIRKIVKEMDIRKIPKCNLTLKDIVEGECGVPRELYVFMECLVKGPRAMKSTKKEKKISSICNSVIYTMSNGDIKPSSCIMLALTTKSLTGSRKMIEILNRMGFCISYTLTEELETELAFGCSSIDRILPYGLVASDPTLRTHLAFDNFDKFVDTSSGKDTLHDTVGIVYQNMSDSISMDSTFFATHETDCMDDNNNDGMGRQRRRKYYTQFDSSLEPYSKPNQKPTQTLFGNDPTLPDTLQKAIDLNHVWMLNHAFNLEGTKRWFAWNSERILDRNPIQKIGYLPNINMSPTSDVVVQKTLSMAQDIAKECGQTHIIVTYDLAIASKAYRIQASMTPKFENVFITLGAFHTQLSFFKVSILLTNNMIIIRMN